MCLDCKGVVYRPSSMSRRSGIGRSPHAPSAYGSSSGRQSQRMLESSGWLMGDPDTRQVAEQFGASCGGFLYALKLSRPVDSESACIRGTPCFMPALAFFRCAKRVAPSDETRVSWSAWMIKASGKGSTDARKKCLESALRLTASPCTRPGCNAKWAVHSSGPDTQG